MSPLSPSATQESFSSSKKRLQPTAYNNNSTFDVIEEQEEEVSFRGMGTLSRESKKRGEKVS